MRIILNHNRHRKGITIIGGLLLLALFLIFIGFLVLVILDIIERFIGGSPPSPAQQTAIIASITAEEQTKFEALYPGYPVTVTLSNATWTPVYIYEPDPPPTNDPPQIDRVRPVTWEMSTNLVDWEPVAVVRDGQPFAATNNLPQAFFRMNGSARRIGVGR